MKASYRWLRDLVPGLELDPAGVAEYLALRGAPVEDLESPSALLHDVVVAKVLEAGRHPNADRLSLCTVDGGAGVVQVVCGAPNVRAGAWYPFAPVGAVLPGDFKIKKAKIRGEVSQGMLCSAKELRLGTDHSGILELHGDFEPGQSFVKALGLDDVTLDVEITANRGDLLSHVGLARELASAGSGGVSLPDLPGVPEATLTYVKGSPRVTGGAVSLEIQAPELCPRYLGAVIRGVAVGPSPEWLQQRLRGAGARPINNVVDATNYVMLELGQPLHAFDLTKLGGSAIVVRTAHAEEQSFVTLDDEERRLSSDMLMICDAERPVAIAGVMGGLHSEVDEETQDVLLECAWFDPKSIRSTRRALIMSTDASYRYERGIDPEGMERALQRCAHLIASIAGGDVQEPVLDCSTRTYEPPQVPLRLSRVAHVLGIPFTRDRILELLDPLGFALAGEEGDTLTFRVPGFRALDVSREIDLIEEIARGHGYDAFPADLGPYRPNTVPDHPLFALEERVRDTLAARGLFETQTPAFVPAGEGDVEVANPLATTEPFMRGSLLPSLLRRVGYNLARGNKDVRLFELGTSFRKAGPAEPPVERPHLALTITGRRRPVHWSHGEELLDAWDLKGHVIETTHTAWGDAASVRVDEEGSDLFDPTSGFVVEDGSGRVLGRGGRVRDGVIDAPAWAGDVWGFELELPSEPEPPAARTFVALPHFPAVERDLALLVPHAVAGGLVLDMLRQAAGPHLEDASVFDLYEGEGVPEGMRSIAYRLRFRDRNGTLTDKQVDRAVDAVRGAVTEGLGVQFRG